MDTATLISDEVRGTVQRTYPDFQRQIVLDQLATVSNEWTRQSILVLANGDCSKLCELVELAELDYREIRSRIDPRTFRGLPSDELVRRRTAMGLSLPKTPAEINAERLRNDVINYIAEKLIVSTDQLCDSTQLQKEFGLAGTAGDRFVRAFADRFDVDLKGYDSRSYFATQSGETFWGDIKTLVIGRRQRRIVPIAVRYLLLGAENRKWALGTESAR